jgi:hypothetical protein
MPRFVADIDHVQGVQHFAGDSARDTAWSRHRVPGDRAVHSPLVGLLMARRSKVVGLPKAVKEWLDSALIDGNFADYELLAGGLKAKGYDISKSSLHRYGSQFEKKMAAIKIATEQAKAIGEAVPDDENAMGDALLRVIQEKTFSMLMNMEEEPKIGFAKLASIAIESGFSSTNVKEFRSKVKTKAKDAASEVAAIAKKAGASPEAIDIIKKRILGIAE